MTFPGATKLHVLVSGASGLIGSQVVRSLVGDGHRVSRLVRHPAGRGEISWDPEGGTLNRDDLEGVDAVIHLAGENVGTRWTRQRKQRIYSSRVHGTRLLSETLAALRNPPRVLVSASAVGIYGNRGDTVLTESSPTGDPDHDFLVSVCLAWEKAADPARVRGVRVVHPRFGVVLSRDGGALRKMLPPFRWGVGGQLGDGRQWMSWISIDDAVGSLEQLVFDERFSGPVNLTAPEPVRNQEFTEALARVLGRPAWLSVPKAALRLALGEMANSTLLSSARVQPAKLLDAGYSFTHFDLDSALRALLGRVRTANFPP
jgi:uncharacterized protein